MDKNKYTISDLNTLLISAIENTRPVLDAFAAACCQLDPYSYIHPKRAAALVDRFLYPNEDPPTQADSKP